MRKYCKEKKGEGKEKTKEALTSTHIVNDFETRFIFNDRKQNVPVQKAKEGSLNFQGKK